MSAFVGPKTGLYLERLESSLGRAGVRGDLHVMMSSGGLASVRSAAERPVTLLLSGPAAGILGGQWAGELTGRRRLITFDMGGTSADIGIVTELGVGEASARDTWVGGYPLLVPMLDVHTIGAGGGSIAFVDPAGAFRVGPRSAGAMPGPACYGLGGVDPTVTDAHVVLGRIDPDRFLGGQMRLDVEAARAAVSRLPRRSLASISRRPRRGRSRSPTPTWPARSAPGRSRRATTHASSRWSPSAAPGPYTRPRWRSRSTSRRSSSHPIPGSPRPAAC